MTNTIWATGGIVATIFLAIIFSGYAIYNNELGQNVNCPPEVSEIFGEIIAGNNTNIVFQFSGTLGLLASPCAGLPWWVYLFIFIPMVIGIAITLTPFIGN